MKKLGLSIFLFYFLFTICSFSDEYKVKNRIDSSFLGVSLEGLRISEDKLANVQSETGFFLSFVNLYLQWTKDPRKGYFPLMAMQAIWDFGAVPVITWEPMYIDNDEEKIIAYEDIVSGKYDQYLAYVAKELKKFAKPVILRFAHEMNLSRYHWGVGLDEYNESYPEIYKSVYKYIYTFFRYEGVANILWAFCPNSDSVPAVPWNEIKNYYPGEEIIDIVGLDGYNWGDNKIGDYQSSYRSFENIFSSSFKEIKKINSKKPFFIFETATVESGGDKRKWVVDALKQSKEKGISCLMWFHIEKEEKWKISDKEKIEFKKYNQKQSPQKWAWEVNNEKIKSFKSS